MAKRSTRKPPRQLDPNALGLAFKRRLKSGELILGFMAMEYFRPSLVKIITRAGYDFIFIEKEHGILDSHELPDFILSARDNRMPVISKVGELNRSEVTRLLDAGVVGIQLPRSETREQIQELTEYVKFRPLGTRPGAPCYGNVDYSWPSEYAANSGAWLRNANRATVIVAHIETALGYENAEEIITTPHLDMVYVGPYDFSISMGYPGQYDHPKVAKAMREILSLCKKHGMPFGTTPSSPKAAAEWMALGAQFFDIGDELGLIDAGARQTVSTYHELNSKSQRPKNRKSAQEVSPGSAGSKG